MSIIFERISGQWKDGKMHGQGSLTWTNGDRYEIAGSKIMFMTFMILSNT